MPILDHGGIFNVTVRDYASLRALIIDRDLFVSSRIRNLHLKWRLTYQKLAEKSDFSGPDDLY